MSAFLRAHESIIANYEICHHQAERRHAAERAAGKYSPRADRETNPYYDDRDRARVELAKRLRNFALKGWHCTRLTDFEQRRIVESGMSLPNLTTLLSRIGEVRDLGLLTPEIAHRLRIKNQAHENDRLTGCLSYSIGGRCVKNSRSVTGSDGGVEKRFTIPIAGTRPPERRCVALACLASSRWSFLLPQSMTP